ncbi:MAG TPA: hypothetical protein VGW38_23880 [Chloroflexota bacterium]|nr:hypothetical protein [Chloroflexota bacterium]
MSTTDPAGPEDAIHFRVTAIERFSLPNPVKQNHMVLRVEYTNPKDRLRGASFEIPAEWYLTYQGAIADALASGVTYWVDWDYSATPGFPLRQGDTVAQRLLKAIADRQIVPEDASQA